MTCRYCEKGERNDFMPDIEGQWDAAYIQTTGHLITRFRVKSGLYSMVTIPIEYCPKCGRKLDE